MESFIFTQCRSLLKRICFHGALILGPVLLGAMLPGAVLPATAWAADSASPDPADGNEKVAAIRELMEVTGVTSSELQLAETISTQMINRMKSRNSEIPAAILAIVKDEISSVIDEEIATGSFQERLYGLYSKHFTLDEIKGLVAFNRSPLGQKANQVMPQLMRESREVGIAWAEGLIPSITQRLQTRLKLEAAGNSRSEEET